MFYPLCKVICPTDVSFGGLWRLRLYATSAFLLPTCHSARRVLYHKKTITLFCTPSPLLNRKFCTPSPSKKGRFAPPCFFYQFVRSYTYLIPQLIQLRQLRYRYFVAIKHCSIRTYKNKRCSQVCFPLLQRLFYCYSCALCHLFTLCFNSQYPQD